jgi:uncharacterized membrane protein
MRNESIKSTEEKSAPGAKRESLRCRVVAFLDRLGNRTALLATSFAAIYFLGFGLIAAKSVVTNDELFTLYIARLPSFRDVWAALATGAEQTPPFFYAVSRADIRLLGTSGLALRLPEMLAFALMCACLYCIVARRTSAIYGLLAALLPLMTTAFNYTFDARAYALVLGFSALGLLCWLWAADGRRRTLALAGLAVSMAAAISSHYYAVLCLVPLGLGEVARSLRRKKIDAMVWIALLLSLSPLVAFLPLIESARKFAPHFWAKPHWSSMAYFYEHFLLTPSAVPLMAVFLVVVVFAEFRQRRVDSEGVRISSNVPSHEIAAVIGYLLIPVVGVVLAKTAIGAFSDRYALPAVIGLSVAIAWGLYSLLEGRSAMACGLALLLCALLAVKELQTYRRAAVGRSLQVATYAFLEANAPGDAPIIISGPMDFTELTYKAPAELAGRLIYVADPRLALQYTGSDDAEKGLVEMKSWAGLNVRPYDTLIASGQTCYIYVVDYPDQYEWIVRGLRAADWNVDLKRWQEGMILFSATPETSSNTFVDRMKSAK